MTNQNPSVNQIIQIRKKRSAANRHSPVHVGGHIALVLITLLSVSMALTGILSAVSFAILINELPSLNELNLLLDPSEGILLEPTVIFDRSGEHILLKLENPAARNKQYLTIDDKLDDNFSKVLINATVSTADPTFWNNQGYTLAGIVNNDHPTIAQRFVVDLLLWDEPTSWKRAIRERLLAAQITEQFGREQVLEWYLNSANYGRLAYGADAAARIYFGKSADDLTLAEAAILAATAETPGLNPHDAPDLVAELQNTTLQAMLVQGYITADEYKLANEENIEILEPQQPETELAPAFVDFVLEQLSSQFDLDRIRRGGLQVTTSLDYDLQTQAWCTSETQLARISQNQDNGSNFSGEVDCEAARLLPSSSFGNQALVSSAFSVNVVVLNPSNGEILAMVGNSIPGYDPSQLPGHSPGTIISPFIYLTAFTRGYNPASLLWDVPASSTTTMSDVENPDQSFHGPVRLRTALVNDYVIPAVQMLTQMGSENILRLLRQVGIDTSEIKTDLSTNSLIIMEDSEVTLLEVTQAYGVIANNGISAGQVFNTDSVINGGSEIEPVSILQVTNSLGELWMNCQGDLLNCQTHTKPVISAQLAYLMTHILSDETARWSSLGHPNPLEIGRPAAAKIGQTSRETDAWTVGYIPGLIVGVWMGSNNNDLQSGVPISGAAGIWHAIIQYATQGTPLVEWPIPAGISSIEVCDPSGMLPTDDCPEVVTEVFQNGREPTQGDTLFRSFQINRETGRLATVFTPPELVETRVFMVFPPEASAWASQAGLLTPPESYDMLDPINDQDESVNITSPEMFANISGQVVITGDADDDQFEYYRIQIGEGLNPSSWLQISDDLNTPVSNGELAVWDTTGLEGLYALQLLVVDQDQNVKIFTTQVTIDNQPPGISIRYPEDGQDFTYPEDSKVTFEADASDNLELAAVTFYLNDILLSSLKSPPYAVPWETRIGKHTLKVRAVDLAGNTSEEIIKLEVTR